ncbi:TetR/AcrR family transcriptional regulator [Kytococcus sedentarius]|uniref:TetR/AcrR family transcriptional regulator n=1 Tax=Kytococcus sedentarius TaxID=1276 RepID=UPI00194DE72F|nr:TetR/AcrR family transcriptional regulator [Kytococcus sedentarius]QRO87741.1 TetR/AcrR family transcriptional regulator [Kytococcus sedentarius]
MATREESRQETRARILGAARQEIAERGGVGLSMRAVARASDLVSSAVYRYFPSREALLTAMIIESYEHLAGALREAPDGSPADRWRHLASAFRDWARQHPHEFQLVYGTPIPGYQAPPETVPAATAVASPFLAAARNGAAAASGFAGAELLDQLEGPAADLDAEPARLGAVLAELAALVGAVSLELAGHLVGTADPADHLFAALVERQVTTLGLD